MQKLDSEAKTALLHAVSEVRESLFLLADDSNRLTGCADVQDFLQHASNNLGKAEDELEAESNAPVLVVAA